jgi:pathogenesis-related protein 1
MILNLDISFLEASANFNFNKKIMKRYGLKLALTIVLFAIVGLNLSLAQEIKVYTMEGCGRCAFTLEYLRNKGIKFTEYSTENDSYNSEMWNLLRNSGLGNGESVSMPVVVLDGKVNYSIPDLESFLSNIGNGQQNSNEDIQVNNVPSGKVEVYTMEGCGRCAYTVEYLENNNIEYVEYSTNDDKYNSKMWELVQASGKYDGESISMPVVVFNGEVSFNIADLETFLSKIGKGSNSNVPSPIEEPQNGDDYENPTNLNSDSHLTKEQKEEFIRKHNEYRSEVGAAPLQWSDELAKYAQEWGEHLVSLGCEMQHRPHSGAWAQKYGENLYWCSGMAATPSGAVDSWGEEKSLYDGKPINNSNLEAGHYTQMIWFNTTQVGCAIVTCSGNEYLVVCNYNPAGNYIGESPYKN